MAISYNKLWKLLVDKKMSKADLRKAAGIAPNTMTRLRRDEEVTLTVLNRICSTLEVDIGDIMEFLPRMFSSASCSVLRALTVTSAPRNRSFPAINRPIRP